MKVAGLCSSAALASPALRKPDSPPLSYSSSPSKAPVTLHGAASPHKLCDVQKPTSLDCTPAMGLGLGSWHVLIYLTLPTNFKESYYDLLLQLRKLMLRKDKYLRKVTWVESEETRPALRQNPNPTPQLSCQGLGSCLLHLANWSLETDRLGAPSSLVSGQRDQLRPRKVPGLAQGPTGEHSLIGKEEVLRALRERQVIYNTLSPKQHSHFQARSTGSCL